MLQRRAAPRPRCRRVLQNGAKFAVAANGRIVRSLQVHARCSERRLILDPPFVDHAAKGPEEPNLQFQKDAANVGFLDFEKESQSRFHRLEF